MKVKQRPEDFEVEELTDVVPGERGPFALYRLEKCGWTTPDAVQTIRRRWQLDLGRVSFGGLKDRHARTVQYLTIFHGPRRRLTHQAIHLEYLGQVEAPYESQSIRANRFRMVLRALTALHLAAAMETLEVVRRDGVPNYFDDQRFGSVTPARGGEQPTFMARLLVEGRFEEALRQALTAPYEHDRSATKKAKSILGDGWGDWAAIKARLPAGGLRQTVSYLVHHPADFRGALARLRPELRGLYLSAYQSHLWNRILARWIETHLPAAQLARVSLRLDEVPVPLALDDAQRTELASLNLPLPTARLHLDPADPRLPLMEQVLAEEGLELNQLKVKGIRELFFSKGERAAWSMPTSLGYQADDDELNRGQKKLMLGFDLGRGSYATLIVKRVTAGFRV